MKGLGEIGGGEGKWGVLVRKAVVWLSGLHCRGGYVVLIVDVEVWWIGSWELGCLEGGEVVLLNREGAF